ncbi:MAG: ATP-binding protein, partial [Vicinamibacterales bacterium]
MAGEPLDSLGDRAVPALPDARLRDIRAAQTRLLYSNAPTAVAINITSASLLSYCQWDVVPHLTVLAWLAYMTLASTGRYVLTRRYWAASPPPAAAPWWGRAFTVGAAAAGIGWGAAGVLLYADVPLVNQVLLIFVIGGMMLGGSSVLAPRVEAFLAFQLPAGLVPAAELLTKGDRPHVVMSLLSVVFTAAALSTTWRIHRTIAASLRLRFENDDLVRHLRVAGQYTEAVNTQLESRVKERTVELQEVAERLRAEITQREQVEEELLQARKLESLGVLAGGIAHDFNNFLTVVQANIDLARLHIDPEGPLDEILGQTERACQRAVVLSTQLLTFSKGGAPIRRVASLARLMVDAVDLARAGAAVSINLEVPDDLWCAEVDSGQVGQVLHNILLNAKEASPDGAGVDVRAENVPAASDPPPGPGALVRITVRDHGSGIDSEVLPLIFDPYFTTKGSGSGLGLA